MNQNSISKRKNTTPQWQVNKMKTIIANRWSEVWHIVEVRTRDKK